MTENCCFQLCQLNGKFYNRGFSLKHFYKHTIITNKYQVILYFQLYIIHNYNIPLLADSPDNEARTIEPVPLSILWSLIQCSCKTEALCKLWKKLSLLELNYNCEITTTTVRLRTKHFKSIKILPKGSKTYVECRQCLSTQPGSKHLFGCPAFASGLSTTTTTIKPLLQFFI